MKVFISADMEGIGGIVAAEQTDPEDGGQAYQEGRRLMTLEVNAAVEGCVRAGATEVVVADSHWNFRNLILDELHEAASPVQGRPRPFSMMQGLDGTFDAAMYVGYHGMRGTPMAVLEHTYSGLRVQGVEVNGRPVGEGAFNAYLAGHHGVPVVLATGDSSLTKEMQATIKGIHTVAVKEAFGRYAAKSLHPSKARALIQAEATRALEDRKAIQPLRAHLPVTIGVEFANTGHGDLAELIPGIKRVGGKSVQFRAEDYLEAFRTFVALLMVTRDD